MNKLESSSIGRLTFKTIIRSMFDDCFDIDETYIDHSECRVQLGAHIELDMATELVDMYGLNIPPSDLVGTWMIEATATEAMVYIGMKSMKQLKLKK